VARLLATLDELGIQYYAGGSVASSIHGVPRFTQDVDLVADLKPEQAGALALKLSSDFYADAQQMREALRHHRSFNVIHFATGFKIDIFSMPTDGFHTGELARSEKRVWEVDSGSRLELNVASAEDTILEKLVWYKGGGQVSERQWNDILGIAATTQLDLEYLGKWAPELGVTALLERLLDEARQL